MTSQAVRERIKPIAWNQAQITDGSHLLVFAAWEHCTAERINHMFDLTNEVRGLKNEGWGKCPLVRNAGKPSAAGALAVQ